MEGAKCQGGRVREDVDGCTVGWIIRDCKSGIVNLLLLLLLLWKCSLEFGLVWFGLVWFGFGVVWCGLPVPSKQSR